MEQSDLLYFVISALERLGAGSFRRKVSMSVKTTPWRPFAGTHGIDRWATTFVALHELGSTRYSQALPRGVSPTALGVRLSGYAITTACFLTNPGSNSMPRPGPVGTVTTPSSVFSDDVLHSNGTSSLKPLNSWYGPALGIADTK